MRLTRTLVAIRFAAVAQFGVAFEVVLRTVFRFAGTVLRQVAFTVSRSTYRACGTWMACRQIATFARRTRCIRMEHTSAGIAAGILTKVGQSTVALFARFDETVTALRRINVKQLRGFVAKIYKTKKNESFA